MGNSGNNTTESAGLSFVDILFSAVVGVGLTGVGSNGGLLQQEWARGGSVPSPGDALNLGVLAFGLLMTALSWFGYHRTIALHGYHYDVWSMLCFVIDIAIIALYGVILMEFTHFEAVLVWSTVVFALYVLWELCFTRIDHLRAHPGKNLLFFVLFLVLTALNLYVGNLSALWLAVSIVALVGFRVYSLLVAPD